MLSLEYHTYNMFIFINLFAVVIYIIYKYLTINKNHWKKCGIPEAKKSTIYFGHFKDVILMKKNLISLLEDIYKEHKNNSMIGVYKYQEPILILNDLDLIQFVLQNNFSHLSDHIALDKNLDPLLSYDPFFANDEDWKNSRPLFTNSVTSKKIKLFLPAVIDQSNGLLNYLNNKLSINNYCIDVEVKNIFSKFTASVAASVILGVDGQLFVDKDLPDSFKSMMDTLFIPSTLSTIRKDQSLSILNIGFVPNWVNKKFQKIVDDILLMRKNNTIIKNDILQCIIDQINEQNTPDKFAAAYAFAFFIEIYETSSLTLSAMTYFIAKNYDIQMKLKNEINNVFDKHGELTYEALNTEMNYFDQVLKESLRLLPPSGKMLKICSKSIKLEGQDGLVCNLKKGDKIIIPVYPIHKNPDYWTNPDEFIPERFDKTNERHRYSYLPFGAGPRMCPGQRFAVLEIKIVMSIILKNYTLEISPKMIDPIQIDPRYFLTTIKDGYWIKIKRENY